ncbi:MAG: DUF6249 domain-containing protein [Bacteroidales bacterium]|nr:DUF6249 domain-containing protein [Bacteroidales bacterium]
MNKVIVTLLLLLSASAVTPAWSSKTSVSMKGDTTTVIEDGDTTRVVGGINIGKIIERALGDTLVSTADSAEDAEGAADDADAYDNREANMRARQAMMQEMVQNIVTCTVVGVIFIIFFSLLFYYLHRKAKYRMMEKAIENNYPLPGTPMMGRQAPVQSQPVAQPQSQSQSQPQSAPPQPPVAGLANLGFNNVQPYLDWRSFHRSFMLIAVGVALMLFFAAAGSIEMVALMSILVLIGAAQALINYQQQKQVIARQLWQQQHGQQPAAQPQQPPVFKPHNNPEPANNDTQAGEQPQQ